METHIKRREFITLLGGAAVAWPLAARAQQRPAMPVLGVLYGVSAAEWAEPMAGFHRGLSEMGFVEGRNIAIEYRWADGQFERMPAMAAELVGRKVAVILAGGSTYGVRSAMLATQSIPIVFTTANDPVATGLVASLNRPGGNVTGLTLITEELLPKQLELLHEAIPAVSKIALLVNPKGMVFLQDTIQRAKTAATRLGLELVVVNGSADNEIESAFSTAIQQRTGALQVAPEAFLISRREQIATLALRHSLATIGPTREAVTAGMLMSYSASVADTYRQAGIYVGLILKGEKPADLPVMQPTKFDLVVNLKTARAIGLTISETFLVRADEVIE